MEHKVFRLTAFIISNFIVVIIFLYDYFSVIDRPYLILKIIPLILMMVLNIIYVYIYTISIYAVLMFIFLCSCCLGDLFLGLFSLKDVKEVYLIVGGTSFFISRIVLFLMLSVYPNAKRFISYDRFPLIFSHILFNIPFIAIGFAGMLLSNFSFNSCLFFIYVLFGFGFQTSSAFLRIGTIHDEAKFSSWIAFIGVLLFNISDILLFVSMFTNYFPSYVSIISINVYWLGIYLLTLSVVRYSKTDLEYLSE